MVRGVGCIMVYRVYYETYTSVIIIRESSKCYFKVVSHKNVQLTLDNSNSE